MTKYITGEGAEAPGKEYKKMKNMQKKDYRINIRVNEDTYNLLKTKANNSHCTVSEIVTNSINNNDNNSNIDKKGIYKGILQISSHLERIEKRDSKQTEAIRKEIEAICQLLNS